MSNNTTKIIQGLEAARRKEPTLAEVIDLHCALLEAQGRVEPVSPLASLAADDVEHALEQGIPLLHLLPPSFDWPAVSRLAIDVSRIVADHRPDLVDSLATIRPYLTGQNGQIEQLATRYLNNESLDITLDGDQPLDQELLTFVLNQTLRPFLHPPIQNMQSKINSWSRPICPTCGGPPDFAALDSGQGNNGHGRQLLCARCDTEWGYQRGGCPFCGQTDQWAYFSDQYEIFRLYVCDACRRYLKTVDWRQTFAHRSLPVARVVTVNMDLAAVQAGYK